jgi:hypothetical protein
MLDWKALAQLSDAELATQDIAAMNLACAAGLPGSDKIDPDLCSQRLDYYARYTAQFTKAELPRFHRKRWDFHNSVAYFKTLCLITALQRQLGVRFNPAKIPEDAPLEPEDSFIHGVLQGPGGTCATMPVVYIAVGRRLGYPLKLVAASSTTAGHLFVRWDGGGERFNIEAAAQGLVCHPDDYYRQGRYQLPPGTEKHGCLLRSMTPREALSTFLGERGHCWLDASNLRQALDSFRMGVCVAAGQQAEVQYADPHLQSVGRPTAKHRAAGVPGDAPLVAAAALSCSVSARPGTGYPPSGGLGERAEESHLRAALVGTDAATRAHAHQADEQVFDMLKKTPPVVPGAPKLTERDYVQAANQVADRYIRTVDEFLASHPGAKPKLGKRTNILDKLGVANAVTAPWCADWAEAMTREMANANRLIGTDWGQWKAGDAEHNFLLVRSFGFLPTYPIKDPATNILLFDPWRDLLPRVYKPEPPYMPTNTYP